MVSYLGAVPNSLVQAKRRNYCALHCEKFSLDHPSKTWRTTNLVLRRSHLLIPPNWNMWRLWKRILFHPAKVRKRYFFIARHLFCTTKEFLCSSFFEETNDFVLVFELYCVRKELNLVLEALFRRWVSIFYTQRFSEAMTIGECHSVQTPRLASSVILCRAFGLAF